MQPLGKASGEASEKQEPQYIGEIVGKYLNRPITDEVHGIYKKEGLYYIGNGMEWMKFYGPSTT